MRGIGKCVVAIMCLALAVCFTVPMGGCQGPKSAIDATAIQEPLQDVVQRHDAYVNADPSLSETQKRTYLRSSAILTAVETEALSHSGPAPGR